MSGALGKFGPVVASLTGMYSTVIQNIANKEETSGLDLFFGAAGGFAGNIAGTSAARGLTKDAVEDVGSFVLATKTSTLEIAETSVTMTTSTTIIIGTIVQITPAAETAAYGIVQGTVGALVQQGIDHGLLRQVCAQPESESYYMHRTRGLLFDADW